LRNGTVENEFKHGQSPKGKIFVSCPFDNVLKTMGHQRSRSLGLTFAKAAKSFKGVFVHIVFSQDLRDHKPRH
jgi:hypothetical protein